MLSTSASDSSSNETTLAIERLVTFSALDELEYKLLPGWRRPGSASGVRPAVALASAAESCLPPPTPIPFGTPRSASAEATKSVVARRPPRLLAASMSASSRAPAACCRQFVTTSSAARSAVATISDSRLVASASLSARALRRHALLLLLAAAPAAPDLQRPQQVAGTGEVLPSGQHLTPQQRAVLDWPRRSRPGRPRRRASTELTQAAA